MELPATHFLEIIAAKNRVIYEVIGSTVYIQLICDSRQDFPSKIGKKGYRSIARK